jgi:hypothetical protein
MHLKDYINIYIFHNRAVNYLATPNSTFSIIKIEITIKFETHSIGFWRKLLGHTL